MLRSFFKHRYWVPLCLFFIFLLAFGLRVYQLGQLPNGLHEDEMMNGYVGRFILQNGKDLYGNRWPLLYFNNFGDYPPVIPMYLSGVSTFIFGITVFAVRFPIALAGSIAVIPMYLILRKIFLKERYALAGAFFLAILPWHIVLSRSTAENITAGMVHLWALYFLFEFFRLKKLLYGGILTLLQLSKYFLYASFRVTIPLSLLSALFFTKSKKIRIALITLTFLFSAFTLVIGKTPWGQGRFKQTSIFYFNNTLAGRITRFGIEEGQDHIFRTRLFHNKPVVYVREFTRQYLSYFSPNFLFTDGGLPHRYLMEDTGLLYITFAGCMALSFLLYILGLHTPGQELWTKEGRKLFAYLFLVLLISPIPSALTLDDVPNVHRVATLSVMLIFPLTFFFASLEKIQWKKVSIQSIVILALCVELLYFWHQFSVHSPHIQSTFRGDDRTSLANYLIAHHQEYDAVYLPHDAKPLYYLFFSHNFDYSLAGTFGPNIALKSVDNLIFTPTNCPTEEKDVVPTEKTIYIERAECAPQPGYAMFAQIKRYDGSGSFRLLKKTDSKDVGKKEMSTTPKNEKIEKK